MQNFMPDDGLTFACPQCHTPLSAVDDARLRCPSDGRIYEQEEGIWRFLLPERQRHFAQFVHEYETVRRVEGRGSDDPSYFRRLPFAAPIDSQAEAWQIRALSFQRLLQDVVSPLAQRRNRSLRILDLGAGSGWLAYQLAFRGHTTAAVDLTTNPRDGLGAHVHFTQPILAVQAEFDRLPWPDAHVDLVIFNASFHYSTDYETTLQAGWHTLMPGGVVAIVDSPIYHDGRSGATMVRDRAAHFRAMVGFPSTALPHENYLTYERLPSLAKHIDTKWMFHWPIPRWRWWVRRLRAKSRGEREPAQFPIISGQKS